VVVDDGPDGRTRAAAERTGARYIAHERTLGLNAARNTAIEATSADWLFFTDDDVEVRPGWLAALLAAAGGAGDDVAVLAGAIRARIDNPRYESVLVDRGFVADTISARPPVDAADTTPVEVTGVLRMPEHGNLFSAPNTPRQWFTRDAPAMAAALHAPRPAPLFLMAETRTNPEWDALTPLAVPVDIPNNHFSYALTWYGLAGALLGVYAAMLFRRRAG